MLLTTSELASRDKLEKEEIEHLMDRCGVNKMDLADAIGVTFPTFQTYYYKNLSETHHKAIVEYFASLPVESMGETDKDEGSKSANSDPVPEGQGRADKPSEVPEADPDIVSTDQEVDIDKEEGANTTTEKVGATDEEMEASEVAASNNGSDEFDWLEVESIIFRPKSRLPEALLEASQIASEHGQPVKVRSNGKIITIGVEAYE